MSELKLGLLDFGYRDNITSLNIIESILDYITTADQLNFTRFWLGEHHNFAHGAAWSSPEIILPLLLGNTDKIIVGMAGVLINYHSPYVTALNYKLLGNLYPGRLDLGFANGSPRSDIQRLLLNKRIRKSPDNFFKNIEWISGAYHREEDIRQKNKLIIPPYGGEVPNLFLLGTSCANLPKALPLKLNFSRSLFHRLGEIDYEKDKLAHYREAYKQAYGVNPVLNIAFMGVCHRDEQTARHLAQQFVNYNYGASMANSIIGTPDKFEDVLSEYQEKFGINEFIFYDCSLDCANKKETLYLLSEKFNL